MKLFHWFLIFIAAFWLVIIALWVTPELPISTGETHPEYATMQKSGTSVATHPAVKLFAYLFGLGVLGVCCFCIMVGAGKRSPELTRLIRTRILVAFILIALVYSLMVFSYWSYSGSSSTSYFGGLPTPTAWMIYGVWFIPLTLAWIYVFKFDSWIITKEELERFQEIVAKRRQRELEDSTLA